MLRFILVLLCLSPATSIRIDTSDGGYEDVLVSINQNVPYNESIVDNIKALFRCSSTFLHRATSGRVFFKHVTIEFPMRWPKRDSARALSSSSFERSDVRIELPTETYSDVPFTKRTRPCGKPGDFIQLTPGFLAQTQNFTMQGCTYTAYMFVHQWAHYRYGVFDEYGIPGDKRYPLIYCPQAGVDVSRSYFVKWTDDVAPVFKHRRADPSIAEEKKLCHLVRETTPPASSEQAATSELAVMIDDYDVTALIDAGVDYSVISSNLAQELKKVLTQ
ncbi:calcium-activated chloride channel regulator family member 3-like [Haemaphysalis longicornis]